MAKRNRFLMQPNVRLPRCMFDRSRDWIATMTLGKLYPMLVEEVLPGDSHTIRTDAVVRLLQNFKKPIFADLFLDVYYFKVPNRLAFADSDKVFANPEPYTEYTEAPNSVYPVVPGVKIVYPGSIADYMGLPPFSEFSSTPSLGALTPDITLLPFRDLALIWNNWFRDENIVPSTYVYTGAAQTTEALNVNAWSPANYTGMLPPVSKVHDYFTSCLPSPQVGPVTDVFPAMWAPLDVSGDYHAFTGGTVPKFDFATAPTVSTKYAAGFKGALDTGLGRNVGIFESFSATAPSGTENQITGSNLGALVPSVDISVFRFTTAYQRFKERLARGGSRYTEFINSMFGVTSPDARLMIPEYIGGRRIRLNVQQVAQTAPGSGGAADVGQLQGYSLSVGRACASTASVEHSFIIGVACIRQRHVYQQGVERFWTRKARDDYFNPIYDHLSEQPVYKTELFGTAATDQVFGFQGAWDDYRYGVSHVTGFLRSTAAGVTSPPTFDMWHIADYYQNAPTLNSTFLNEDKQYLDRTIVNSSVDQFIVQLHHNVKAIRVMSAYSVPKVVG